MKDKQFIWVIKSTVYTIFFIWSQELHLNVKNVTHIASCAVKL